MNKISGLVTVAILTTVVAFSRAAEKISIPSELNVSIGGFLGQSYWVSIENDSVVYSTSSSIGLIPKDKLIFHPTELEWNTFRSMLDEANVWKWKKRYENSNIKDGTQWHLKIKWKEKSVISNGTNAFPDRKYFDKFLNAVQVLIKGNEFR